MDQLRLNDYQMGLFSSSSMYRPVSLDRTAFAHVPDLEVEKDTKGVFAWKRDRLITSDWLQWLDRRNGEKPFFGENPLFGENSTSQENSQHSTGNADQAHQLNGLPNQQLNKFCDEIQGLLLAELDVRLQPTLGFIEAVNEQVDKH